VNHENRSSKFNRRAALKTLLGGAAAAVVAPCLRGFSFPQSQSENQPTPAEREAMARVAGDFMRQFNVPALCVAIAEHGHLAYESAFGFADRQARQHVTPSHLFRIASVTKPITATAIFTLIERGKLSQYDRVFGSGAILGATYGHPPYKKWVEDITIDHLLTHTCGGWDNSNDDPMFQNPQMNHAELMSWTLDTKPLKHPPGTHYAYSNFGYCVLGRVIEHFHGRPYDDFVREAIFSRCGIRDMRIAGNTLTQRFPNEVVYYGQGGENPYNMNVTRMDSHGGWLASPRELVLFLNHLFESAPNLLKPGSIQSMTAPSSATLNYARGWAVNEIPNWWHNGSLPGATTIMVRTHSGFCWAALTNTRTTSGPNIGLALDNLIWGMVRKVGAWHA
jgi:CubicO group peptidase (beta-lactamase class C family)